MGNNSVFDRAGLGASDLGLSVDPNKIARDNQRALDAQKAAIEKEKAAGVKRAAVAADKTRVAGGSRSNTLLTGPAGLLDEDKNVSRKTLLGS